MFSKHSSKSKIKLFLNITSTNDENHASRLLKKHNGNVSAAVSDHLDNSNHGRSFGSLTAKSINPKEISQIFQKYKDEESGTMYGEKLLQFTRDLKIKSTDSTFLLLCWKAQGECLLDWTEEEFIRCFIALGYLITISSYF